ncbi:Phosphoinositide 3-phosphatase [Smittium mucronatum]|uniref:Phosphoinositide 3-phosphatase n=1 Tax=Smittium mucronatum TaxID=133383 RepID=A0A1R0GL63_9FUNG|nr:Phosphoinositide 3-phosphatase [Smittium mucronatum]
MIHSAILYRPPKNSSLQKDIPNLLLNENHIGHNSNINSPKTSSFQNNEIENLSSLDSEIPWEDRGFIQLKTYDFDFLNVYSFDVEDLHKVFWTIKHQVCKESVEKLHAFFNISEPKQCMDPEYKYGWKLYDVYEEFRRMGIESDLNPNSSSISKWRFSLVNQDFKICPTYPDILVVPSTISDTTLTHASKYRSKGRIPVLCYLFKSNNASISRSSQPLVGLKQARSVQDEKLVESIFATNLHSTKKAVIVDARPTTNAVVNRAVGAGSENMSHYKNCRKLYLGIDNIHVMRSSYDKLFDAIKDAFLFKNKGPFSIRKNNNVGDLSSRKMNSAKNQWLEHISDIISGANEIVCCVLDGEHVLVHCSDGWDRTAQLTSLAQLCLDPFYRTIKGFLILIEKEWVRFGHQFTKRNGLIGIDSRFTVSNSKNPAKFLNNDISPKITNDKNLNTSSRNIKDDTSDNNSKNETPKSQTPQNSEFGIDNFLDTGKFPNIDFKMAGSSIGNFASRTFKGMQSRFTSALIPKNASEDCSTGLGGSDVSNSNFDLTNRSNKHGSYSNNSLFGSNPNNETCPVFSQFLDCVYQILRVNESSFEFNDDFLIDLNKNVNSCRFGDLLCDNIKERYNLKIYDRTPSMYAHYLSEILDNDGDNISSQNQNPKKSRFINSSYDTKNSDLDCIIPSSSNLELWSTYYLQHLISPNSSINSPLGTNVTSTPQKNTALTPILTSDPSVENNLSNIKISSNELHIDTSINSSHQSHQENIPYSSPVELISPLSQKGSTAMIPSEDSITSISQQIADSISESVQIVDNVPAPNTQSPEEPLIDSAEYRPEIPRTASGNYLNSLSDVIVKKDEISKFNLDYRLDEESPTSKSNFADEIVNPWL